MWIKTSINCLVIMFVSFFIFGNSVNAGICDREHVNQLKALAKQVEVSYEYIDNSDSGQEEFVVNLYSVSVNLISDELYINDGYDDYYYADSENGLVNFIVRSGKLDLTVYSTRCTDIKLRDISLTLPKFNTYSYTSECKKLVEYDLDVCDPWYQGTIDDATFIKIVDKYLNNNVVNEDDDTIFNKISNFIKNYYLYIIGGIVLVILIVVVTIIKRKRSVLE